MRGIGAHGCRCAVLRDTAVRGCNPAWYTPVGAAHVAATNDGEATDFFNIEVHPDIVAGLRRSACEQALGFPTS